MSEDKGASPSGGYGGAKPGSSYEKYVRHFARDGWTAEKYARMSIYMFLYNKVRGMPKLYGLKNNTVSWMIRDYIKNHMPELVEKFNLKSIEFMDFNDDVKDPVTGEVLEKGGLSTFIKEIDSYNEHASELCGHNGQMPTNNEIMELLTAVEAKRSEPFEAIRKSVKRESGESFGKGKDGSLGNREGWLLDEKLKKVREIQEHKRQIRRNTFWTGAKALGIVGCAGGLVASGMLILAPGALGVAAAAGTVGRLVAGGIGLIVSGGGLKSLANSIAYSFGKLFGQHRKLRDLKNQAGYKGKRGLKAIERQIEINEAIKKSYGEYGNLIKKVKDENGRVKYIHPTMEEFEAHILKKFPILRKATEEEAELKNLFGRARERYSCISGSVRRAMDFVRANETTVISNNEIPLEREDEYNNMFGDGTGKHKNATLTNTDKSLVPTATMNEYIQTVKNLDDDKDRYYKNQEPIIYKQYQTDAATMLPLMFQRDIFDKPFTDSTFRDNNNLVTGNEIVQRKLKENNTGDKTPYVKNALKFIHFESNDKVTQIRSDLGVTVKQQLSLEADNMVEACESLGVPNSGPEHDIVVQIANQISGMEYKNEKYANDINSRVSNPQAREYLLAMLEKRNAGCKKPLSDIQATLGGTSIEVDYPVVYKTVCDLLANIKYDPERNLYYSDDGSVAMTLEEVKNFLFDKNNFLDLNNEVLEFREKAYNILLEQISSVERRKIDETRAETVDLVRTNNVNFDLDEVLNKIQELTFDKIVSEETLNFYRNSLYKVQPVEVRKYAMERFKIKIEELFEHRINTHVEYTSDKGMEEIAKDLILLNRVTYLDDSHRERIMNKFQGRLVQAFNIKLENLEMHLLEGSLDSYSELIYKYRNLPYTQGGFKELFALKSPIVDQIESRLRRVEVGISFSQYLFGEADGASKIVDSKSPETRMFLKIFFKNGRARGDNGDMLTKSIVNVNQLFNNINKTGFIAKDSDTDPNITILKKGKDNIDRMRAFFDESIAGEAKLASVNIEGGSTKDLLDQKALLVIFKRKALGMFKTHLARYIEGHREDAQTFVGRDGAKALEEIKKLWKPLFEDIDRKMDELRTLTASESLGREDAYIPAMQIFRESTAPNNFMKFINSTESTLTNAGGGMSMGG
ncbi:MAG: hypothetical protein IJX17_01300 [Clostridia bacterium]|nr:hypothetical protein [Clostridia bacterium]